MSGQQHVADRAGNITPMRPVPREVVPPKGCDALVEYATARGWLKHDVLVGTGWEVVKQKGEPTEPGKAYSMQDTRVEVEQYVVRLRKGTTTLVLVWHNGKWQHAISNRPMAKYNTRTVRRFMEATSGE